MASPLVRNVVTSSNFFGVELPVKCMFCNVVQCVIFYKYSQVK